MPFWNEDQWDGMSIEQKLEAMRVAIRERHVVHVPFVRVDGWASIPRQGYRGDAGFDLSACRETRVRAGCRVDVPTGICAAIPDGFWGHILPRSGVLRQHPLLIVHEAVIDSGFRGELKVLVEWNGNTGDAFVVKPGQRIAQIVIVPLPPRLEWLEKTSLPASERGDAGFGSTGMFVDGGPYGEGPDHD